MSFLLVSRMNEEEIVGTTSGEAIMILMCDQLG